MATELETIDIKWGKHATREQGMCVMEFWAFVRKINHTDHPPCACPIFTSDMIKCNDALKTDAARNKYLRPFALRLAGMNLDTAGQNRRRNAAEKINNTLNEAIASSKKIYDEAIAPSEKIYDEAIASSKKIYYEAIASSEKIYDEAIAPSKKIYDEAIASSKKIYDEAIAPSEKIYDEKLGPLMVKCIEELLAVV